MIKLQLLKQVGSKVGLFFCKTATTIGMWKGVNAVAERDEKMSLARTMERLEKEIKQ